MHHTLLHTRLQSTTKLGYVFTIARLLLLYSGNHPTHPFTNPPTPRFGVAQYASDESKYPEIPRASEPLAFKSIHTLQKHTSYWHKHIVSRWCPYNENKEEKLCFVDYTLYSIPGWRSRAKRNLDFRVFWVVSNCILRCNPWPLLRSTVGTRKMYRV